MNDFMEIREAHIAESKNMRILIFTNGLLFQS